MQEVVGMMCEIYSSTTRMERAVWQPKPNRWGAKSCRSREPWGSCAAQGRSQID